MPILRKLLKLMLYSTAMDTKKLRFYSLIFLFPFIIGCPWKDQCLDDVAGADIVDGLIVISPLKDTFKIGDSVSFEINVPDSIDFGNGTISLINETNDQNPLIVISQGLGGFNDFFKNDFIVIHGERVEDKNAFKLYFCFEDNLYKLFIKTTFNKVGKYRFSASNDIVFGSQRECNLYRITTNVNGVNGQRLEFVVIE